VPAQGEGKGRNGAVQAGGFSLHAGLDIQSGRGASLARLCRYVDRPPVAVERLALFVLEPLDLMARLAALVPPPRRHLTRYHGVVAPHSRLREAIRLR
jgi:hypothetical protein